MKLSAQEEYGLRCLLHLARRPEADCLTIPEISHAEGLSVPNVAKLMRLLRMGGLVKSARGQAGGYTLARQANQILISDVLKHLGGQLYSSQFCDRHAGLKDSCTHQVDCSIRVLWNTVQKVLDDVLGKTTLQDLLCNEHQMESFIAPRLARLRQPVDGPAMALESR